MELNQRGDGDGSVIINTGTGDSDICSCRQAKVYMKGERRNVKE